MDLFDIAIARKLSGGGGGGGGGDSDFSTAQVTIYNNAQNDFQLIVPNLYDETLYASIDSADIENGVPVPVPLYKGQIIGVTAFSPDGYRFGLTGTGGVHPTWGGDAVEITGDGTLTIADA